ncbi:hypothetical protein [Buchananella hordeovulneris]|uniref:hypothetical protein n=1 Tax=Buchananella hordeovulneris TaxID=52770 RepID=UPI0026DAC315|nr:hypothetical protein [Buchananella hordeovulneris]MDO5080123.1 hypothetical protein [Buchananella hordeovulneris]
MSGIAVTVWVAFIGSVCCLVFAGAAWLVDYLRRRRSGVQFSMGEPWLLRAPLLPLVLAVVAGIIAVYALILRVAFTAKDFKLPIEPNKPSAVLVAATLMAGVLTAAYAVLRLRAHLLAEVRSKLDVRGDERAEKSHQSDQEVVFTERFSKAVAFLSDEQPMSRIAGVHLILALGDEWVRGGGQQRCFDVILSHLRALGESRVIEDELVPRGLREEVRLITSEVLRRLSGEGASWAVNAGDFSGTVVADLDITGLRHFPMLDLRGARVLGNLTISGGGSEDVPKLTGVECDGTLTVEWGDDWGDLDLSGARVGGDVFLTGETLDGALNATNLIVEGQLSLSFESFRGDVLLDSAEISGGVVVGSPELGATYGTKTKSSVLSLIDASFQELKLCRSARGPRLNLTNARGAVDLSYSSFPLEVTANGLDASTGLNLRGSIFLGPLVFNDAMMASSVDIDGIYLSESAKNGISSSEFALRDRFLSLGQEGAPVLSVEQDVPFDWKSVVEAMRGEIGEALTGEIISRLEWIENRLPLDWDKRPAFRARVMTEVSRAAAKVGAPNHIEGKLRKALVERLFPFPSDGGHV